MSVTAVSFLGFAGGVVGAAMGMSVGIHNIIENKTINEPDLLKRTSYITAGVLGPTIVGTAIGASFPISVPAILLYQHQHES